MNRLARGVTVAWLLSAPQGHAAQAPDAGQTLRQLQPPAPLTAPAPTLERPAPPPTATSDEARLEVSRIRIVGNRELATEELRPLVAGLEGGARTLTELQEAAARITQHYRERGYPVARAFIPEQDVVDGLVTVQIAEGRVDRVRQENASRVTDAIGARHLGAVKVGDVVRSSTIDRAVLLLGDLPGVGGARAALQPGAGAGTSELLVALDEAPAVSGYVNVDTYGNRYTGQRRAGATVLLNSPLGYGDQVTLSRLVSDGGLEYSRAAYQAPVGGDGLRLGGAYASTGYRLGRDFSTLIANGNATSTSAYAWYPVLRTPERNVYASVTREHKTLHDAVESTATLTDKRVRLTNFALAANARDGIGGGGITSAEVALVVGRLDIDSPVARAIDDVSVGTRGGFTRMAYAASRLQRLGTRDVLWASVSGQSAAMNLDSSEKFTLGGPYGVRAFPQGEASGDSGYVATVEWRRDLGARTQSFLFYDHGQVAANRYPVSSTVNHRALAGGGAGLNLAVERYTVRMTAAWRTRGTATTIPSGAAYQPQLWLLAGRAF